MHQGSGSMASGLFLGLEACGKIWVCIYIGLCLLCGALNPMLHVTAVGLLLSALTYFKLPPPDPSEAFKILGCDPRNLDGTPSKTRGALGLVAHRGAGLDAPENTLESLRLCKKKGAKCVEFDVALTLDNVAVVFHDDTVDRVSDKTGHIDQMTFDQVKQLDVAAHHPLRDGPCRVPTLEEYVAECLKLDLKMIIDLKTIGSAERVADVICDLYKKNPRLYANAMTSSFHPDLLYAIRRKDLKIVCSMAWRPWYVAYKGYSSISKEKVCRFDSPLAHHTAVLADYAYTWAFHNFLWYFLGLSAVLVNKDVLTPEYVQKWRERGIRIMAWTVNNSFERLYIERALHVTVLSDTMDEIGVEQLLKKTE